uniref:Maestro heat like repeat family member 7 n=1 Tax=Myotis myotis TaxID=51298 RepID=A0A7J7RUP7_MYOMY|nr:hypothetical protein mMyoMyo1_010122 [Myotis myotis]
MNPDPNRPRAGTKSRRHAPCLPSLTGLRQSEREAYQSILRFLRPGEMSELDKMTFLRAVDTLAGAVRAQASGSMNNYIPKTLLAKKIETLMLEEGGGELLTSSVRQQAMLSIVALSQVDPPFHLDQKLDLVNAAVACVFSLPLIVPSQNRKESASLYLQTVQALDDMLQALVMDGRDPNMAMLQRMLEIVLPWLTMSEKEQEQGRAAYTISHLLRFTCNFPELLHLADFSISGRLMATLGIFCMSRSPDASAGASEGLHYLFKVLVLHRSMKHKTELILRELQKHFRGEWLVYIEDLAMFFREFLSPEERMDAVMVFMEAMASDREDDVRAASKILRMTLKSSMPEIGKVPEMVEFIYHNMNKITEATAQETMRKVLQLLAQAYADDVILTLLQMQDQSHRGNRKPWEILASIPQSYVVIMEHLLRRLTVHLKHRAPEASDRTQISPLIATRAMHELLLEPSRRMEVQTLFPPLFMALLIQTSFLVVEGGAEAAGGSEHATKWMDPVSSTVEALKTLMWSTGYGDYVSYVQTQEGWELLTSPERHYEGVTVLARAMATRDCWHNCPVFSLIIQMLREQEYRDHLTAFVLLAELLRCREVVATVDEATTRVLASWFQCEEPATVKLLLRVAETFALHGNMTRQLGLLQPYVLNCCHSEDGEVVTETFLVLRCLVEHLTWQKLPSFLVQLAFTLGPFFEAESEPLRLKAFEIYGMLLAKVKRSFFASPLKHQVLNSLVLLVVHLADRDARVAQVCRLALCRTASILGWWRLRAVFADRDLWTILRALLEREAGRGLWLLTQSLSLLRSPQAPVRQAAVWFTGQVIQSLEVAPAADIEEACTALRAMSEDPDPSVRCLATQTLHVLEASKSRPARTRTPWLCCRRRC